MHQPNDGMFQTFLLLDGEIRNNSENYTFVPAPVTNNRAGYGHWFPGVGLKTKQFPIQIDLSLNNAISIFNSCKNPI